MVTTISSQVVGDTLTAEGSATGRPTVMQLIGIHKAFGETKALQGLDLQAQSGEILGIAGPNGAGKSTLIKILAGEETRDAGTILVDGAPWSPGDPEDRVAVVHQEPQVWMNLTLGQNLLVGREGTRLRFPELSARDNDVLRELDIAQFADRPLQECPLAVRQRAEIGRAVAQDARFFLFDEPNSALTEDESNRLFAYMHDLARTGRIVMLVTHRLAEIVAHCDRVVVIRDGRVRAVLEKSALTEEAIARELVVGHESVDPDISAAQGRPAPELGIALQLDGWGHPEGIFRDVSLTVARGEIMAVVGVEGSGARELVASAAGYAPGMGSARIGGSDLRAVDRDTVYLSADRRGMLFPNLSVGENLVIRLGTPQIAVGGGMLSLGRLRRLAQRLVETFRIRAASVHQPLPSLSGGNQQKVAIAAAIAKRPTLLVLEEPTRGVDVGSKADIYRILREFAQAGNGVLVYCTEVPEVFELADSVLVVESGRPVMSLRVAEFEDVTSLAAAIATGEHTAVEADDLVASHAGSLSTTTSHEGEAG